MDSTPIARDEFPVLDRWLSLDHAGVAPLPRSVATAVGRYLDDSQRNGSGTVDDRLDEVEGIRARTASFVGASTSEIAFVKNTTEGLAFVAGGLDWRAGDRVIVPSCEFPSTRQVWEALSHRGVEVELIDPVGDEHALSLEAYAAALTRGGARLVATSWVQFGRGWRVDLAALAGLCHRHGALLCADVIQGLGAIPLNLHEVGVDFAAADAHKWMLGPEGIGVLYVAEHNIERLRPLEPGWNSMRHRGVWSNPTIDLDSTARRFEGGTHNVGGIFGLGAAVDLIAAAGIEEVWAHVDELASTITDRLRSEGLRVARPESPNRSGIVSVDVPGRSPEDVCTALRADGILTAARGGRVRIAPHGYNDRADVERLCAAFREFRPCRATTPRQHRMLAVFAHPDDEVFCAGGTLAAAADAGAYTVVVSATRGQVGEVRDADAVDTDLGTAREAELRSACERLGVSDVIVLDHLDGAVGSLAPFELDAETSAIIDTFAPDTVITFGPDGASGHADHIAIGAATTRAAREHRSRPQILHCHFPPAATELHTELSRWVVDVATPAIGGRALRSLAAFAPDIATLHQIADDVDVTAYEPGTTIVRQGERQDGLYLILSGEVEIRSASRTLAHKGAGEFFGELAIARCTTRTADVVSTTGVSCLRLAPRSVSADSSEAPHGMLSFDVTPWLDRKLDALRQHRTQFPAGGDPLPRPVLEQLLGTERFVVATEHQPMKDPTVLSSA